MMGAGGSDSSFPSMMTMLIESLLTETGLPIGEQADAQELFMLLTAQVLHYPIITLQIALMCTCVFQLENELGRKVKSLSGSAQEVMTVQRFVDLPIDVLAFDSLLTKERASNVLRIVDPPESLVLHLQRFNFDRKLQRVRKVCRRAYVFPAISLKCYYDITSLCLFY